MTKIGIKKLIDLMDIGARQPQGEAVVYSAAQVLANIAAKGLSFITSFFYIKIIVIITFISTNHRYN